jgi:hypothetical protein
MSADSMPRMNMDNAETGCCPRFDPSPWEGAEIVLEDEPFVLAKTTNFMHIPLNMGSVMTRTWRKIQQAGADAKTRYLVLSHDPSPWRGEHYFWVTKDVPDTEMVHLSATLVAKVFEGPYRDAGKWAGEMKQHISAQGRSMRKLYFFYTSCPKCIRHYGKNYVVAFAEV